MDVLLVWSCLPFLEESFFFGKAAEPAAPGCGEKEDFNLMEMCRSFLFLAQWLCCFAFLVRPFWASSERKTPILHDVDVVFLVNYSEWINWTDTMCWYNVAIVPPTKPHAHSSSLCLIAQTPSPLVEQLVENIAKQFAVNPQTGWKAIEPATELMNFPRNARLCPTVRSTWMVVCRNLKC